MRVGTLAPKLQNLDDYDDILDPVFPLVTDPLLYILHFCNFFIRKPRPSLNLVITHYGPSIALYNTSHSLLALWFQ